MGFNSAGEAMSGFNFERVDLIVALGVVLATAATDAVRLSIATAPSDRFVIVCFNLRLSVRQAAPLRHRTDTSPSATSGNNRTNRATHSA